MMLTNLEQPRASMPLSADFNLKAPKDTHDYSCLLACLDRNRRLMTYSPGARLAARLVHAVLAREHVLRRHRPGRPGAVKRPSRFPYENPFCMGLLYGRAGRLTAKNGGFRPGQEAGFDIDRSWAGQNQG